MQKWIAILIALGAVVLTGCATATDEPAAEAHSPGTAGAQVAAALEPAVQVGGVSAVYVTVTNSGSEDIRLGWQQAESESGYQVASLDVDHAIERAGGADKLAPALRHMPSVGGTVLKDAGRSVLPTVATFGFLAPLVAVVLVKDVVSPNRAGLLEASFDNDFSSDFGLVHSGESIAGYLFFPRGKYTALNLHVGQTANANQVIRCRWESASSEDR